MFSDSICQTEICRILSRQRLLQPFHPPCVFYCLIWYLFAFMTRAFLCFHHFPVAKHFVSYLICARCCRNNLHLLPKIAIQTPLCLVCLVHRLTCACRWSIGHSFVFHFARKGHWSPCFSFTLFATKKAPEPVGATCSRVQRFCLVCAKGTSSLCRLDL